MSPISARAGMIARGIPQLERLVSRHVLGLQPDPGQWPIPDDVGRLPIPDGVKIETDAGQALALDYEFSPAWHRRRTAIGAHAYRFETNSEFDCGWRLADVAARVIEGKYDAAFDLITIVPPPTTYGSHRVLPWAADRLARRMGIAFEPSLFRTACPLGAHPDRVKRQPLPLTEIYRIDDSLGGQLKKARVLLADWRRYTGRTLLTLARMLRKQGADVTCFMWLG